jgi:predicted Zn-dependent protease
VLTGQIEPAVAADIIAYNQNVGEIGNPHAGTIMRFDLPIRVYVDSSFDRFSPCAQRAVATWTSATGFPIVFTDTEVEPRIEMIVMQTADSRARTLTVSVNLDNSLRSVNLIMPTWGPGCDAPVEDTVNHEFGHALGIVGHPDWGGVMAHLPYGVNPGVRKPSAREVRMLVGLYSLPLGAHLEPDGTWIVP